jgi:hypothetical protein
MASRRRRRRQLAVAATGALSLHLAIAASLWPARAADPDTSADLAPPAGASVVLVHPRPPVPATATAPTATAGRTVERTAAGPSVAGPDEPVDTAKPEANPAAEPAVALVAASMPAEPAPAEAARVLAPVPVALSAAQAEAETAAERTAISDLAPAPADLQASAPAEWMLAQAQTAIRATPGADAAPAVPVYPVQLPAPRVLAYDLTRGALSGTGELRWEPDGDRYRVRMEGRIAGFTILRWTSVGGLDRTGLAPIRYTDRRSGGREHAANFVRADGVVRYSGPSIEHVLPAAGQDRLSWMVQIAAVVQARTQPPAPGERLQLWVSGARGDADVWSFRVIGPATVKIGGEAVATLALLREPRQPYDTRVEVWLDPSREHLPVRARLSSGRSDDALELTLQPVFALRADAHAAPGGPLQPAARLEQPAVAGRPPPGVAGAGAGAAARPS